MQQLSTTEIDQKLAALDGWTLQGNALHRDFTFDNFRAAFAFMSALALVAERLGHHPDWSNSYGKVSINLSTHHADGLTQKDFSFAAEADSLAKQF